MRLTPLRRIIVPDGKGGKRWAETSAKALPPGYPQPHFSPWLYGSFTAAIFLGNYALIQVSSNPDGFFGTLWTRVCDYVAFDMEKAVQKADERERLEELQQKEKSERVVEVSSFTKAFVGLSNWFTRARGGVIDGE
ncbi:unnamed protein product [Bursaphelenchus xylophilus]|uniref:(pine wood nematode) hypothetical protein n=1 Tax=Bursaphelenchus xylophilus TaxID=6326 RepID=A0A1I7SEP6_BURXY|nr:unnamed protein product [Bursaphelenchus xylophilus]CAG9092838.1 unnamed protein product [Bursaphelenchus xylophilus]